ncbi:hypothetical protein ACSBR2_013132 [Camellia fascicularis]
MGKEKPKSIGVWPAVKPFVNGGASGMLATCVIQPIDMIKVGDPLEKAALKGIEWSYKSDEKAMPKKGGGNAVQIVQRHHFTSDLKRMAVVVRVQEQFLAFVKGAPETTQDMLIDLPSSYVKQMEHAGYFIYLCAC